MGQDLHAVLELCEQTPKAYLCEIKSWIAMRQQKIVSKSALHNILRSVGYTYKHLRKEAAEHDEEHRAVFHHITTAPSTVTMAVLLPTLVQLLQHRLRVVSDICPALTLDGYIAVKIVEDSFDGTEFTSYILSEVLPHMNPFPGKRSVLIMDNCHIHKSAVLRAAVKM
ncbi:hypothetical protein EXIGLDRAFT_762271 [Exidia glandulosa HHB12029]|uniref:Tc1-like transposase DDE domain-containing protein n=1 Tax=Exidia glandulosa HHB12029 TaxID=1314781 RepID=A0A165MV63_EXIGL|nr:hypothetical protein EXIGLDRAFT_762271 [Exidia glandulosa HHB12029]